MGVGADEKALGKKLQKARQKAGLTQQELCQRANLSYSTLAKIERGAIKAPSVFTVAAIAMATDTPMEKLLDLTPPLAAGAKRTSKTGVKFVYFDVNGTLVRYYQRGFTEAADELGVPAELIETHFWRHNDETGSGQLSLPDFNQTVSREIGASGFDWQKYYMNNVEAVPGMDELLKWATENYEVGILSNNFPGFIDQLRQKGCLPDVDYKAVVDSSEVGAVKPEAKIYEIAQKSASVEASQILLVDDTRSCLTAADKLGWQILEFDEDDPAGSITRVKQHLEF